MRVFGCPTQLRCAHECIESICLRGGCCGAGVGRHGMRPLLRPSRKVGRWDLGGNGNDGLYSPISLHL